LAIFLSDCKNTILLVESDQADSDNLKHLLSETTGVNFNLQCIAELAVQDVNNTPYDVLLISQTEAPQEDFILIKEIQLLQLGKPIIYLTNSVDMTVDQKVMQLGADDCLAKSEISNYILTRTIQHSLQRKINESQLAHLSTHDHLTGLANRYLLYEHLERTIKIVKRSNDQFAILFMDIDKFKLINDSLGHDVGDILLVLVADRLTTCVRDTDIVARFGNDEFAVLLEDSGSSRNMVLIATKLQKLMAPAFNVRGHELFITFSIGIACYPECGSDPETLFKCADSALYKAKELGRNKFHFFTEELDSQARLRLDLEKNLRRALINGEFEVYLQPQVNTISEKITGAEALLRWCHPKHGMVSPVVFIPLLEDLGLLPGVEAWVLHQVCLVAKRLTDEYGQLKFSVNISGIHFKSRNLKENIYLALQSSSLDAVNLEIELTEDIMIEHVEYNSNLLNELKELGISIALDDFGKGYSSLSYLKNFPANILKIDKAFIDHIVSDKSDAAIVEAMIDLSHKLNIKVVAEGVEDKAQLLQLRRFKCDYIQGYYFAKPMTMQKFERFLINRNQLSYKKKSKAK
jgi:diguanylate cyclase (GGDEF)-like protein